MNKRILTILIFTAVFLTGCGDDEQTSSDAAATGDRSESSARTNSSNADRSAPSSNRVEDDESVPLISAPRLTGQSEVEGQGLEMVIYASDRREYQESLRLIAEQTSDKQFQQLDAALRYLMINDPSIMNNEQLLFQFVNGKTGMEVLQATANLVEERSSR